MAKKKHQRDTHHRVARCNGGTDEPSNLSNVRKSHHQAFHHLFRTGIPEHIAKYLNEVWIDPKKMFVVIDRPKPPRR